MEKKKHGEKRMKPLLEHLKEPIDPFDKLIVGWNLKEIKEAVQKNKKSCKRCLVEHKRHLGTMDELREVKKELKILKEENKCLRKNSKIIELVKCEICGDFIGYKHFKGHVLNKGVLQRGQGIGKPYLSFCPECQIKEKKE